MPHSESIRAASPMPQRYREASRAALLGLLANLLLGIAKLVGGIVGNSFALISDAVNSLGDVLTSAVVLVALRVAQRPADVEHPYGHARAEAIAASNVAVLIIFSAVMIGWEAISQWHSVADAPPVWALWIAGANVAIKEALYQYKVRVGRRTGSTAIIANAWDHRADALSALAVLVGLAIVRWGGEGLAFADKAASLVVVAFILWSAGGLFYTSVHELLDLQADDETLAAIRTAAASVPGVLGIEKLRVRKMGLEHYADIHLEVDPQTPTIVGHEIGHRVKDRLLADFPTLRDVLVHLEPYLPGRGE